MFLHPKGILNKRAYWVIHSGYFVAGLTVVLLVWLALQQPHWGYDEYGAVTSHVELDNEVYTEAYLGQLLEFGVPPALASMMTNSILPVFVVPLRWTYATGISPVYDLARYMSIEWELQRLIFIFLHITVAFIGLALINRALFLEGYRSYIFILFVSGLLYSEVFIYWVLTLTSYSFHILCFGLLLYASVAKAPANKIVFGIRSICVALALLFNYQYIPVVVIMGVTDFSRSPRKFFHKRRYKKWVLPACTALIGLVFLLIRMKFGSGGESPAWSNFDYESYSLGWSLTLSGLLDFQFQFVSRCYDIFQYIFLAPVEGNYFMRNQQSSISYIGLTVYFCSMLLVVLQYFKKYHEKHTFTLSGIMILSIGLIYIFGVQPMTPSRHALILLQPFLLIVIIILSEMLYSLVGNRLMMNFSWAIFFTSLLYLFLSYDAPDSTLHRPFELSQCLSEAEVERMVLSPCDLLPVLSPNLRESFRPVYRCGPQVFERIGLDTNRIAVYSTNILSISDAKIVISAYSDSNWTQQASSQVRNENCGGTTDNVLVFDRAQKSADNYTE